MGDVELSSAAAELARRGTFVRVELRAWRFLPDKTRYRSVFVARVNGNWVGYANVCRHHPVELDVPDMAVDAATGVRLALVGQDGQTLMCASHGALYRPRDGYCTTGPCSGTSLAAIPVRETADDAGAARVTVGDDGDDGAAGLR